MGEISPMKEIGIDLFKLLLILWGQMSWNRLYSSIILVCAPESTNTNTYFLKFDMYIMLVMANKLVLSKKLTLKNQFFAFYMSMM